MKYLNIWVLFFGGHRLTNKWDSGKIFPNDSPLHWRTCSNSSLELWKGRKDAINLIPVKSYKKASVFISYSKVTGRYHKSFPKPSKVGFTIAVPFKANASFFFNAFQYSGVIKPWRNLPHSPIKTDKKSLILQTNTVTFIICLNCKVFIRSAVIFMNV